MIKVEICYWRRLSVWRALDFVPGCEPERIIRFNDIRALDLWQYCPYCGRPLSTATEEADDGERTD